MQRVYLDDVSHWRDTQSSVNLSYLGNVFQYAFDSNLLRRNSKEKTCSKSNQGSHILCIKKSRIIDWFI